MSIITEIERLQQAKTNIKSAIENKGVTVGDGTIDTYAKFIEQISGSNVKNYKEDTITFDNTDVSLGLFIEHNLGVVPDIFLLLPDYEVDYTVNAENAAVIIANESLQSLVLNDAEATLFGCCFETRTAYGTYGTWFISHNCDLTETTAKLPMRSASYDYRAGVPYKWIAAKLDETSSGSGDYEQGYEDGKNSVVSFDRYLKTATFTSLNMFDTSEAVLNFDSIGSLGNLFYCDSEEERNTTVEHLTINCPTLVTTISQMLYCQYPYTDLTLKRLTLNVDTQNCSNYKNAFTHQRALEIIDGKPLDYSSVTASNINGFYNCVALVEVRFVANSIKYSISFANCSELSAETIQSIIDGLADLTGGTAQTLTLHATVGGKLTDTQKATITAKNWTLVY